MGTTHFRLDVESSSKFGLKAFSLERLESVVVLAGANGSGKTRLLRALKESIEQHNNLFQTKHNYNSFIQNFEREISAIDLETRLLGKNQAPGQLVQRKNFANQVDAYKRALAIIARVSDQQTEMMVHSIAPKPSLDDPWRYTQAQAAAYVESANTLGNSDSSKYAIGYIQRIFDTYWDENHQLSTAADERKRASKQHYEKLKQLIQELLGDELTFEPGTRKPVLFGRLIGDSNLSNGQKILIQVAVDLHAKGTGFGKTLIILDEPELHLHPSAAIDIVDRLVGASPDVQVWIATHCVPLLAHLHASQKASIFFMKDGGVEFAGTTPSLVLDSLLGDESRTGELREFVGFADRLAITNFASQCLISPPQISATAGDPQVNQIAQILSARAGTLRILDFGAGKGRLFESLHADAPELLSRTEFFAFEKDASAYKECRSVFARRGHPERVFSSEMPLLDALGNKSVDVVVMCNVLHEIDPDEWPRIFADRHGVLLRALKDDGYVLIVEDMEIPKGENAHKYGFFVLDTDQLRGLFDIESNDATRRFTKSVARGDRLKAHLVGAELIQRVTPKSRGEAIERLQRHAQQRIEAIRTNNEPTFKNGRLHAFWLSQFANASLWLSKHGAGERSR